MKIIRNTLARFHQSELNWIIAILTIFFYESSQPTAEQRLAEAGTAASLFQTQGNEARYFVGREDTRHTNGLVRQ
jgi:hypothetical protein